mmetsp:Transcript_57755/g.126542  ORF Transcript_57755/g.126542 Transcript_57755/m.126542 type:complete len:130 (+) Transcript_57755:1120-1509(+)
MRRSRKVRTASKRDKPVPQQYKRNYRQLEIGCPWCDTPRRSGDLQPQVVPRSPRHQQRPPHRIGSKNNTCSNNSSSTRRAYCDAAPHHQRQHSPGSGPSCFDADAVYLQLTSSSFASAHEFSNLRRSSC